MPDPPHGPPEITEAQQAATAIAAVGSPTPDNVSRAVQNYSPGAVAAAAASIGATGGGGGSSVILTTSVSLTAADILAFPVRQQLVEGAPGVMVLPIALLAQTEIGTGGYDMTDVMLSVSSGYANTDLPGLSGVLAAGGAVAYISEDLFESHTYAAAGDVLEGGLSISSNNAPTPDGDTPDWGFTGTLYYFEFIP